MAKYKATVPWYAVKVANGKDIIFDYNGNYETNNQKEIDVLDKLVPMWVKKVADERAETTKTVEKQAEDKPNKPKRKASAK